MAMSDACAIECASDKAELRHAQLRAHAREALGSAARNACTTSGGAGAHVGSDQRWKSRRPHVASECAMSECTFRGDLPSHPRQTKSPVAREPQPHGLVGAGGGEQACGAVPAGLDDAVVVLRRHARARICFDTTHHRRPVKRAAVHDNSNAEVKTCLVRSQRSSGLKRAERHSAVCDRNVCTIYAL